MPKNAKDIKDEKAKLVIGVDFDDVLFNFNDSLHAYHNAKYGTSVERKDIASYDIEKVWGCTPEEAARKVFEFYFAPDHDRTSIVAGAIEGVHKLKKDHELHIISSRGDNIKDLTLRWIDQNFPGYFKSVNLTNLYFGIADRAHSKAEVCKKLGVDVMIEDSLSQAEDVSSIGCKVILLDCPWNQGKLPDNVVRVYSWHEIVERIEKM